MQKINFEPIGEALKVFDTDKMDIARRIPVVNPDGTEGETMDAVPLYEGIPCHISFTSSDNPDPKTVDTEPKIIGIEINCPLYVDIQNGDYIKAYKLSNKGDILETYTGVCGFPAVAQSRKSVQMEMRVDV